MKKDFWQKHKLLRFLLVVLVVVALFVSVRLYVDAELHRIEMCHAEDMIDVYESLLNHGQMLDYLLNK